MNPRNILLNPGPVTLSERVRSALVEGDWCHREPEFAALTQHLNAELVRVYTGMQDQFDAVIMTGSGTSAVEAMLTSFAPRRGGTLVVANGVYGERMARMLTARGLPHHLLQAAWTAPIDIGAVAEALDRQPALTHIATVQHETTTGRLNDLDALGALCRDRGLSLLLDGVSSFGAEEIDAESWNLAAVAATANKCLHAVPGLSFVVARKSLFEHPLENPGSVYLDLFAYHAGQHGEGYSPFTQSVQSAFALREALAEFFEAGGRAARRAAYLARAQRIHETLSAAGVTTLLEEAEYSSVLRSYRLPDGLEYSRLHDALKARGFVIYAGQGDFSKTIFRLAYMGDIRPADLDALCEALEAVLKEPR